MQMTFWEHFEELRRTLIRVLAIACAGMVIALCFYETIFGWLIEPIQHFQQTSKLTSTPLERTRITNTSNQPLSYQLAESAAVIAASEHFVEKVGHQTYSIGPQAYIDIEQPNPTQKLVLLGPIDGMLLSLKVSFWIGLVATSPIWLWIISRFAAPAIGDVTKRVLAPFIIASLLFMAAGFAFAYHLTIPLANQFLASFNSTIGQNFWTLNHYIDYTVLLMLAHGLAFELFVILLFLIHYRVLDAQALSRKRRHAIVAIFVMSAIFTPPDVFTQILLAIPLTVLYELAICYAKVRARQVAPEIDQQHTI
jgi:sec-independent protein translocase protein TatC